jgi:hypothetical protein
MIVVSDILDEVKQVLASFNDTVAYQKMNLAVDLLANKGNWNPLIGFVDITTQDRTFALPYEVDVPLAVNVGGRPANFRNKWFEFHLNGPGSDCCNAYCDSNWEDLGMWPTFRRVTKDTQLCFLSSDASDVGATIIVYGADELGRTLVRSDDSGVTIEGWEYTIQAVETFDGRLVTNIERISKPVTKGFVNLNGLIDGDTVSTTFGIYQPFETEPSYRRICVQGSRCNNASCCCSPDVCECNPHSTWVRMRFRRKNLKISKPTDLIYLHSRMAILMAVKAIYEYEANRFSQGDSYLTRAVTFLNDSQSRKSGPRQIKLQMQNRAWMGTYGENMI